MKHLFFIFITILFFGCGLPENQFRISISGNGLNNRKAVLYLLSDSLVPYDSVVFERNYAVFNGSVNCPALMYLFVDNAPDYLPIFVENADIKVTYNYSKPEKSIVTGSECHKNFVDFIQSYSAYCNKGAGMNRMYDEAIKNSDSLIINNLDSIINVLNNEKLQFQINYLQTNIKSPIAPYILSSQLMYNVDYEDLKNILEQFPNENRSSIYYEIAKKYFDNLSTLQH